MVEDGSKGTTGVRCCDVEKDGVILSSWECLQHPNKQTVRSADFISGGVKVGRAEDKGSFCVAGTASTTLRSGPQLHLSTVWRFWGPRLPFNRDFCMRPLLVLARLLV